MPRFLVSAFFGAVLLTALLSIPAVAAAPNPTAAPFPVAPHTDVTIEWWYLNGNLTTQTGRHYAIVCSFFRFGNTKGLAAKDSSLKIKQSHYLIYAVTDIDHKKHYTYSLGDKNTLNLLQQAAALELERDPDSPQAAQLASLLGSNSFPPPTKTIQSGCTISGSPFAATYGSGNFVRAVPGSPNTFDLALNGGPDCAKIKLRFTGKKSPMLVNGDGNTGLRVRTDMKYISLTRCAVTGMLDTGSGSEDVDGQGWFDHQWGDSWTTQSAGWDWWGAQLANGTDILFFRQINLKTGASFFPCATFEDSTGEQMTTHNMVFSYNPSSIWKSPLTGVSYPLDWTITFPDQNTVLHITPDMSDEEMPVLANGGAIWEGACSVDAQVGQAAIPGVAYMELVGYNSPSVKAAVAAGGK